MYAIVDFSLQDDPEIRRVLSKKLDGGNVTAVTYIGKVGPNRVCVSKRDIMTMENVPPEKFWQSIRIMEMLYKARGATIEIRNYEGKTMRQAADLMKLLGNAQVFESGPGKDSWL